LALIIANDSHLQQISRRNLRACPQPRAIAAG
jgi:hypothetical protein